MAIDDDDVIDEEEPVDEELDDKLQPFRSLQEEGLDVLFGDVEQLLLVLTQLTNSYRLLVGAAEEFNRTAAATPVIPVQATARAAAAGKLIDQVLKVLEFKLDFALDVIGGTELPLSLIFAGLDALRLTARQRQLWQIRRIEERRRRRREFEEFLRDEVVLPDLRDAFELELDDDLDTEVNDELEFGGDDPRLE